MWPLYCPPSVLTAGELHEFLYQAELLLRPVGRPSWKPLVEYKGFLYQAPSWKTARGVVTKVEFRAGKLLFGLGFMATKL